MKNIVLVIILLFSFLSAKSQIQTDEVPYSIQNRSIQESIENIKTINIPDLDNVKLKSRAKAIENECISCKQKLYGKEVDLQIDILKNSQQIQLKDGILFILELKSQTAEGLQVGIKNFNLKKGEKIFIYTKDKSQVFGAFTDKNNNPLNKFISRIIFGNQLVIEYFRPNYISQKSKRPLIIDKAVHVFELAKFSDLFAKGYNSSGSCTINANCDPQFQRQKKAVALFTYNNPDYKMYGICSGALINSTDPVEFKKPYFITAAHCWNNTPPQDSYHDFLFYFNFETDYCRNDLIDPIYKSTKVLGGAYMRSHGSRTTHQFQGNQSATDYALLELYNKPEYITDVTYLGWDRSTTANNLVYNISHPAYDAKKIAYSNNGAIRKTFFHKKCGSDIELESFEVTSWDSGVTLKGSSGSPLLNNYGRLIGVLHGGYSRCSDSEGNDGCGYTGNANGHDVFSSFDYAWDHSTLYRDKLHEYLDPNGLNPIWLDMYDPNPEDSGGGGPGDGGGSQCQWNVDKKVAINGDAAVNFIQNVPGIYPRCIDDDFIISPLPDLACNSPRWLMGVSKERYNCNSIPVEFDKSLCDRPPLSLRCECLFINVTLVVTEVGSDGFQNGNKNEKNFRFQIAEDYGAGVININELPITIDQIKEVLPLEAHKFYKLNIKHNNNYNSSGTKMSIGRFFRYIENVPLTLSGAITESRHTNKQITLTNATIDQRIKLESQDKITIENNTVINAGVFISDASPDCNDGSYVGKTTPTELSYHYIPEDIGPTMPDPDPFLEMEQISIYPNPSASGIFNIRCERQEVCEVTIFNLNGKQIQNQSYSAEKVDLNGQPKGVYILNIRTNYGTDIQKIVYQ